MTPAKSVRIVVAGRDSGQRSSFFALDALITGRKGLAFCGIFSKLKRDTVFHQQKGYVVSRLDNFIERMISQRACIDHAARQMTGLPGLVLELGLGNGRTYDHLKVRLPDREIYVFDRQVASNPNSTPPENRIVLGDFLDTLPAFLNRMGPVAALIHADMGGPVSDQNDAFARLISPLVEPLVAPGGFMISNDRMHFDTLTEQPLPADAVAGRCFVYRR